MKAKKKGKGGKKCITLLALLVAVVVCEGAWIGQARAADLSEVVKFAAGVNGAWWDGPGTAFPADVEAGGLARASLSPHLSAVGSAWYGFDHSYLRSAVGARATVTDVDDPNFSVGLGIQYHMASESELRPNEWAADASFGWVPSPTKWPNLIVAGTGSYGLRSSKAWATLGLRYAFNLRGF